MSVYINSIDPSLVRELGMSQPQGVSSISSAEQAVREVSGGDAVPFARILGEIVGEANQAIHQADAATTSFARGEQHDLHGTMLALNQANIRLQLVNETRNHLLEAYREIMRMSV